MTDEQSEKVSETTRLLVTWGLNLATTIALGVGAYMFNNLTAQIDRLNEGLTRFEAKVAVLESTVVRQAQIEANVSTNSREIAALRADVEALKRRQ